jgi:hypothetical protein
MLVVNKLLDKKVESVGKRLLLLSTKKIISDNYVVVFLC